MEVEPTTPPAQMNTPQTPLSDATVPSPGHVQASDISSPSRSNRVYSESKVKCQQEQWDSPRWRHRVEPRVVEHPYRVCLSLSSRLSSMSA